MELHSSRSEYQGIEFKKCTFSVNCCAKGEQHREVFNTKKIN
jgi:hypothetical protein